MKKLMNVNSVIWFVLMILQFCFMIWYAIQGDIRAAADKLLIALFSLYLFLENCSKDRSGE